MAYVTSFEAPRPAVSKLVRVGHYARILGYSSAVSHKLSVTRRRRQLGEHSRPGNKMFSRLRPPISLRESLAAASAPRASFSGRAIEDRRHRRTSRSCVLREMPDVKRICYKLGLWVCSLSPRERAQAGHFCPAYASRNPCSFMNHKQGSGGWALLASARSLSAESGNRSGAGAKAAARRTFSSGEYRKTRE